MELKPTYEESIDSFRDSYLSLKISMILKVHSMFFHIKDFCSEDNKGLGYYSEKSMESVHFDFLST